MSTESAFNKRLTKETTMDQVEGLLEHFNLPPKAIAYIRKNQRMIQVVIGIVIVAVVAWSLYSSYAEKQREEAATALSLAVAQDVDTKASVLQDVVNKYGGTSSAVWAEVELAHLDLKNSNFAAAASKYKALVDKTDAKSPLYPLAVFGLAQAYEADKNYQEAGIQYDALKEIEGYAPIGYIGLGRLEEVQGNLDKAIAILNNFVLSVAEDPAFAQSRSEVEAKIARLKALQ